MFSKACEYGLKAMIFLASRADDEKRYNLEEISEQIGSPLSFTSKVLQQLGRKKLILSYKGPTGGFRIESQQISQITLYQIVSAIDGDAILKACGLGLSSCQNEKPCPIHRQYTKVRKELKNMLLTTALQDFTGNINSHNLVLIR